MRLLPWFQLNSWLRREGGSSQFIESHGSDLVLEGILVSHSLWYAKLTSGFWKENLYTHCLLLDVSSSPNQHQCCLQANSFVSFRKMYNDTLSALTRHHLASSLNPSLGFFSFFFSFWPRFLSDGHGENKRHVNPTTKNLCHTEACSLNIKHW